MLAQLRVPIVGVILRLLKLFVPHVTGLASVQGALRLQPQRDDLLGREHARHPAILDR